ncbi:MAG: hypothetical protein O2894_12930, partial [Planctomycetota bacterium]|nr:hypothetical protein [Planctomycetota bacterium]
MSEPQYYIAQGEKVQGPFPLSRRVVGWAQMGRVRPDMLFSREGGAWVAGRDCPEIFGTVPVPVVPAQLVRPVRAVQPAQVVPAAAVAPVVSRGGSRGLASRGRRDDDGPR